MTRQALVVLGIGQCVNWGVLYYAFAVLVLPLAHDLGVATWAVTGAFSLALLVSAVLAPAVGRWGDRHRAALLMQAGGFTAAAILAVWSFMPGVVPLYLAWAGLGACMAAALYEPVFLVIGRAYADPTSRLRALAFVTLFGGLASTVFLPATALLVRAAGWRRGVLVLAAVLLLSTWLTRVVAFRRLPAPRPEAVYDDPLRRRSERGGEVPRFAFVAATFAAASLASAAFTANLVPALAERGISPPIAAVLGGSLGAMQLPGRALVLYGALVDSPGRLWALSLALQAGGLAAVALAPSVPLIAAGTMLFALGAGLTALVRPQLVQAIAADGDAGYLNGRMAREQQLARAAGPVAIAWLAGLAGYPAVFAAMGVIVAAIALAAQGVLGTIQGLDIEQEAV